MKFVVGDVISISPKNYEETLVGDILGVDNKRQRAYVRFRNKNNRIDSWFEFSKLTFVSHKQKENQSMKKRYDDGEVKLIKKRREPPMRELETIKFGDYLLKCWYFSPFPKEYTRYGHLYVCDICCLYFTDKEDFLAHGHERKKLRPPGREIYRYEDLSLFEVIGAENKMFCQCLSLVAKLFLDDIAVFYNVSQYIFYVMCKCDENGAHIAAFFSRYSNWSDNNILACIVVLPHYQRKGYSSILISLAYEIARRNGIIGSPEKPFSDLGKIAFRAYWKKVILTVFAKYHDKIQVYDHIAAITSIHRNDLLKTLQELYFVYKTDEGWTSSLDKERISNYVNSLEGTNIPQFFFDPDSLIWFAPSQIEDNLSPP